jgi:polyisoprenoid-binding protein YceI
MRPGKSAAMRASKSESAGLQSTQHPVPNVAKEVHLIRIPTRGSLAALVAGVVLAGAGTVAPAGAAPETYKIDTGHSTVGFQIRHLVSKVNGRFSKFDGTITFDPANPTQGAVVVNVDPATINTDNERRDKHLKSPDFFDVEKFPAMKFVSKSVKMKDENEGTLFGELTMKGITKPVALDFEIDGVGVGPRGGPVAGFSAKGKINRKDYEILWNRTLDKGGAMLGDDVTILLNVEAVVPTPEPAAPAAAGATGAVKK